MYLLWACDFVLKVSPSLLLVFVRWCQECRNLCESKRSIVSGELICMNPLGKKNKRQDTLGRGTYVSRTPVVSSNHLWNTLTSEGWKNL